MKNTQKMKKETNLWIHEFDKNHWLGKVRELQGRLDLYKKYLKKAQEKYVEALESMNHYSNKVQETEDRYENEKAKNI